MKVPPPYDALIEMIIFEVGAEFDANITNVRDLAQAMQWSSEQVRGALAIMCQQGFIEQLSVSKGGLKLRRYRVTVPVTAAA